MGWIVLVIVFGIAALVPAVWSFVGLARGNQTFRPAAAGAVFAFGLMLITLVVIVADSTPVPSTIEFCEPLSRGGVKQPWATWSDLSFVAAGLWLLWLLHLAGRPGWLSTFDNPMVTRGPLSIIYGLIVIFMGPGSMWFHSTMADWAGTFDALSVVLWLAFNASYVWYLVSAGHRGKGRGTLQTIIVLVVWGGVSVLFFVLGLAGVDSLWGYLFAGSAWGIGEFVYLALTCGVRGIAYQRICWLFIVNFFVLVGTMGTWVMFHHEIPSGGGCIGGHDFPGHALFHFLASLSTVLTYMSFASERRVS